jgi:hypothetical protein
MELAATDFLAKSDPQAKKFFSQFYKDPWPLKLKKKHPRLNKWQHESTVP